MLNDAATNATPTKYVQNNGQGMYLGTPWEMPLAAAKCSAPNTASGMAKHKLARTAILSRPAACAKSLFTAQSAIRKKTMPATDIAAAVRENSKNNRVAGMVGVLVTRIRRVYGEIVTWFGLYDAEGGRRPRSDEAARHAHQITILTV